MEEVEDALESPQQKVTEDDLTVYQKIIEADDKSYLLRVFINEVKHPPVAVTVYRTSNINKYFHS